jgi:tetratricopeptide (TPR) repeat protein
MIYRQIAQVRRNMELVPEAIKGLERIVSAGIYDEDTIVTSFIAAEEFGDLPEDVQSFVDFYQGLDLARRGEYDWAEVRFSRLPEKQLYAAKAEYVRAVHLVAEGDFYAAEKKLERLKKHPALDDALSKDVERSLARLAFEEERFKDALTHFETLKKLAPNDPEIILEMAWTYYYLGDSRKTLGLLTALDAPVHETYMSPERYLLEALALRRLCQFAEAREAAVRLEKKHGAELTALSKGSLPDNIAALRTAAKQRGFSRANTKMTDRIVYEMSILDSLSDKFGESLYAFMTRLYSRGLAEAKRREEEFLRQDIADLTEELLSAQEGVRLIVHELGVSMLRGRRRPAGALEKPPVEVPITGERVFYPFEGEYWTDELDGLVVIAEDRCID